MGTIISCAMLSTLLPFGEGAWGVASPPFSEPEGRYCRLVVEDGYSAMRGGIAVRNDAAESCLQVIGERITVVLIRKGDSGTLLQQAVHTIFCTVVSSADGVRACR